MTRPAREVVSRDLLTVFRERIRPFLVEQQVAGVEALDRQAELLAQALERSPEVNVGFIGEAQVGKSTLINAVVERTALPAGGIGPLTARATSVTFAEEDRVAVTFHEKRALRSLVFAIARYLELTGDIPKGSAKDTDEGTPVEEVPDDLEEVFPDEPERRELSVSTRERGEYMLAQARKLLGADGADGCGPVVVLDGIRTVLGHKLTGSPVAVERYSQRIEEIRAYIGKQEVITANSAGGVKAFNKELKLRAAGWLSPMVSDLRLGLSTELIRGLSLVDLPGVGVKGDPAAQVPKEFVERDANALVIVFRNSGFTEAVADLLERTGVVTRLLFGGRDGHAPIHILVAVTHLDDVARDRYREAVQAADESDSPAPDRHDIFRSLSRSMETTLRVQIRDALRQSSAFEDLSGDLRASREAVVEQLCESMEIVCVAAPDYIDAITAPGLGTGLLTDPVATGIPRFREALRALARNTAARRLRDIVEHERLLRSDLLAHLQVQRGTYEGGRGAALEEWERLREQLQARLGPIREEMQAHHGEILGTLRRGLLERIKALCQNAEIQANKRLQRLTRQGQDLHFMSLKAALTRDGVWENRNINYPENLTFAVLDAIAAQWEPEIVDAVRTEIRKLADRDLALVEQLVAIATELNPRLVAESQIEVQKQVLRQNSRSAVAWTKEQLEELRERVREKLRDAIEPPIARACRRAIMAGKHQHAGAKGRILGVFQEGGSEALTEARQAAEAVLKQHYNALLRKLDDGYLKDHHDPVQAAFDSLTDETNRRARRSDNQRRTRVLSAVEEFTSLLDGMAGEDVGEEQAA